MRRRLYWLMPDLAGAQQTMNDLLLARVEHRHMHFMAHESVALTGLHEANLLQASDFVRSAQVGMVIGAALGAAAGAVLAVSSFDGELSKPGLVGALAAAGAAFGAWTSSMIGIATPSQRLLRFNSAMDQGEILLMVDVPQRRVGEILLLLKSRHPEAHSGGVEPNIPAFP